MMALRAQVRRYSVRGSSLTITNERLSPPPLPRERAFSIRNSVASRADKVESTEPSSAFVK